MTRSGIHGALLAFASAAVLALAGCGDDGGGRSTADAPINFSILSTENSQNLQTLWTPFITDMEKQTGLQIEPFYAGNYTLLIEAMRSGQVQVGWFSNQSGLEAVRRSEGEVFVRSSDPSGVDGYNSVVIVPASSTTTLDDLVACGKRLDFGLGDVKSTSGTLAPLAFLFGPRNIDPQDCFATVRRSNHEANLVSVASSQLDAATNNTTNIKRMARSRPEIAERVRVIWTSPTIPEDPIVWRKDLDADAKEKLRRFFLTYGAGTGAEADRQKAILTSLDFGTFRPADDTHLIPVREMEATEQLIEARNNGEDGDVARAEAALAQVRKERAALAAGAAGQ